MSWIEEFLGGGPDYAAEERHPHEVQTLLQQAGAQGGLTKRQAQDFAGLAEHYMADPKLFAMAVAAVEGPHTPVRFEGTAEHIVIEAARIATSTSVIMDSFAQGAIRVVLHNLDWPQLLWPVLLGVARIYDLGFELSRSDARTVMVSKSNTPLKQLGAVQPVPIIPLRRLEALAADNTFGA